MRGFNTQPPEGGWRLPLRRRIAQIVSTHSRLKAAGYAMDLDVLSTYRFNTQPPEGGWAIMSIPSALIVTVSTHSRLKAAGRTVSWQSICATCFNTQPPEGGWDLRHKQVRADN